MQPEMSEGFLEEGIISPARMRAVDANAMALGVTDLQLMESAGKALADMARAAGPERILVLVRKRQQRWRRHGGRPPPPTGPDDRCLLSGYRERGAMPVSTSFQR